MMLEKMNIHSGFICSWEDHKDQYLPSFTDQGALAAPIINQIYQWI